MEDALISAEGFSILTGAGLTKVEEKPIIVHRTEITNNVIKHDNYVEIELEKIPYINAGRIDNFHFVLIGNRENYNSSIEYYKQNGERYSNDEFFNLGFQRLVNTGLFYTNSTILEKTRVPEGAEYDSNNTYWVSIGSNNYGQKSSSSMVNDGFNVLRNNEQIYIKQSGGSYQRANDEEDFIYVMLLDDSGEVISEPFIASEVELKSKVIYVYQTETGNTLDDEQQPQESDINIIRLNDISQFKTGCSVLVDYYTKEVEKAYQIDITPDDFSGNFYLEASTLFRAQNGVDLPAEFVIPNCKIQSNFTFTMASSGDPSTFTFTMDAFPDYTRWNKKKKVYAAIQIIEQSEITEKFERLGTPHDYMSDDNYEPFLTYKKEQEPYLDASPSEYLNQIIESMDENGNIYNNGLGYKKDYYILDEEGDTIGDQSASQDLMGKYTSIGFIPYKYGQIINIAGFTDGGQGSIQGIYFYNQEHDCIAVKTVNTNAIDYVVGYDPTEDSAIANKLTTVNYIRVTFYNQKLSEMAVYVSGVEKPLPEEENNNG